jgi:Ca2+-binding EF-hand superfamily protein
MGKNISKEKMQEYKDTIKGKFDEKEIKHMYKLFHKAAPSGKMGKKEFKKYIEDLSIFKKVDHQETYEQLFRGYDRDRDGTITFKEYLQYHLGIVFSTDELFDIVFSMYDADGNGYITRDELVEVVTNSTRWMGDCDVESRDVQDLVQAEVDKIVAFVDVNKDGQISKEELYAAAEKHPEILEKLKNLA